MYAIKLVRPTTEYAGQIMQYRMEFLENDPSECMGGCGNLRRCESAQEWLDEVTKLSDPALCPEGYVRSDTYLAVRVFDNRLVGVIDLRHSIDNAALSEWAGHIGYSVRPNDRRRGYAKEMLRLNLANCRALGIKCVLLCCDHDNIASERTILANGGVFERTTEANGKTVKRYWIEIYD